MSIIAIKNVEIVSTSVARSFKVDVAHVELFTSVTL